MSQYIAFRLLPVGARFECNGNAWKKVSTRTARLDGDGKSFYFQQDEIVRIG